MKQHTIMKCAPVSSATLSYWSILGWSYLSVICVLSSLIALFGKKATRFSPSLNLFVCLCFLQLLPRLPPQLQQHQYSMSDYTTVVFRKDVNTKPKTALGLQKAKEAGAVSSSSKRSVVCSICLCLFLRFPGATCCSFFAAPHPYLPPLCHVFITQSFMFYRLLFSIRLLQS